MYSEWYNRTYSSLLHKTKNINFFFFPLMLMWRNWPTIPFGSHLRIPSREKLRLLFFVCAFVFSEEEKSKLRYMLTILNYQCPLFTKKQGTAPMANFWDGRTRQWHKDNHCPHQYWAACFHRYRYWNMIYIGTKMYKFYIIAV